MSEIVVAREEWDGVQQRLRALASEKSYLQLVVSLLTRLGEASGLDATINELLRLVLDSLGGSNISLYYRVGDRFDFADVFGVRRSSVELDDPVVRKASERRMLVEQLGDFEETKMDTPSFTSASCWAMPLLAGDALVGILKAEGMLMGGSVLRERLSPFFHYAALVLKNEIANHRRLAEASQLAAIVQSSDSAIIGKDLYGNVVSWNRAAEAMYGYSESERMGRPLTDLIPPEHQAETAAAIARVIAGEHIEHLKTQRIRRDGRIIDVSLALSPIRDGSGRVAGVSAIATDIGVRLRSEREIRRLGRMQRLISLVNKAIVRIGSLDRLFEEVCTVAVVDGGFDHVRIVRSVEAGARVEASASASATFGWPERGVLLPEEAPELRAIRENRDCMVHPGDAADTGGRHCSSHVLAGLAAPWGAMSFFSDNPELFDDRECALLDEMVADVGFAIGAIQSDEVRRQTEARLKESELRFRTMFENSPVPIWEEDFSAVKVALEELRTAGVTDLPSHLDRHPETLVDLVRLVRVIDVNKAAVDMHKAGTKETLLQNLPATFTQESFATFRRELLALWRGETRMEADAVVQTLDGNVRRATVYWVVSPGCETTLSNVLVSLVDLTERIDSERRLRDSEERLRLTLETANIGVWDWDVVHDRWYGSPTYFAMLGVAPERGALGSAAWLEHVHPDDLGKVGAQVDQVLGRECGVCSYEARLQHADGRYRWMRVEGFGIERDGLGRVSRMLGIRTDITERRRAEDALRNGEMELAAIYEHAPVVMGLFDEQLRLQRANSGAARLAGRTPLPGDTIGGMLGCRAIVGQPESCGLRPDCGGCLVRQAAQRTLETGEAHPGVEASLSLGRGDGSEEILVNVHTSRLEVDGRPRVLICLQDVTDRKRAESALRESEHRFRQVTETIEEIFWLLDASSGRLIYVSPACERVWGCPRDLLVSSPGAWLEAVHPEDRERIRAATKLQALGEYDVEYRYVRADGSIRWIHERAFPILGADGKVHRIAGVAEDVTERRQLEAQFRQSQKMEAVGQLAGGIAHDFNNLLTVIQMQGSFLLEELRAEPEKREGLEQIMDAARRAANLTQQLLAFSRQRAMNARPMDLRDVVSSTTRLLRRVLSEHIALECRIPPSLPLVRADAGMIEQVLMNLIINARDAMPDGGLITIAIEVRNVEPGRVRSHGAAHAGTYACLLVTDTGCGIAPENLPRIFEPFFTTKEVGKGTGLGLATVFGIVEQHNGWLEVDSTLGKGSEFRVYLPCLEEAGAQKAAQDAGEVLPGGRETILLVEDDEAVRIAAVEALRRRGYVVHQAANAAEAMRKFELVGGGIDLVLTDLVMPGGASGKELALALCKRKPGLHLVISSGYSQEAGGRSAIPNLGFLAKPYSADELLRCVRESLDSKLAQ